LVNSNENFEGRVELENTTISNRSRKVFTLNGIADATMRLLGVSKGKKITKDEKETIKEFWQEIAKNIPEWQLLLENKVKPHELRKEFVNTNTNLLNALGIVGNILIEKYPQKWKEKLRGLKNIDWSRGNPEWDGRLLVNGQMVKNALGIELAANTILQKCGVSLPENRQKYETKL
jgi:DNA sulfur modification protein DndB